MKMLSAVMKLAAPPIMGASTAYEDNDAIPLPFSSTVKRMVLIIEDSYGIRAFMRHALITSGYDVFEAGTAFEAYRILRSNTIDAITLDLGLPDEDGLEFLRAIRSEGEGSFLAVTCPVIICSVRDDRGTRETAKKLGACAYLKKPFAIDDLISSVNEAVDPVVNAQN
ncbi:MAG: response regulator [Alphaproteobacteria bacterium]|nr:response regulator [Alphaproteobacteria bacterium]